VRGSPRAASGAEWVKFEGNPVMGGALGTCFDMSVIVADGRHRMWFSWRPKRGIGYAESADGFTWEVRDEIVLGHLPDDPAEQLEVTRPFVLDEGDHLTMWYAAHGEDRVVISRATSLDGLTWERQGVVLAPSASWEKTSLMCPSVLRGADGKYHMWYSGGERYEPDAIGYATSPDGSRWTRVRGTPVLGPGAPGTWESDRVAGAHVFRDGEWLYAAYIGFANGFEDSAIGIARSQDGVTWDRHLRNPVVTRGRPGDFDSINVYKPFVVVEGGEWRMWFNGSSPLRGEDTNPDNRKEEIGYASCRFQFESSVNGKGQTSRPTT
jgi:beta-1,2-mannobiose phosphorylase / 1,2-beta-oligomannan phosphorylase